MIETTVEDDVTFVTLDRPDRRNALTPDALDALETAVESADTSTLCLRGAGSAFCAGADLSVVAGLDGEDAEAFARHGQRVANAIESTPSTVVAAIDGAARGGGVELALACDLRFATPRATFAETGVRLGLFGAWGGTHRLPRVVGLGDALDLALSGRTLDADDALRVGLVSRVVADLERVVGRLAENDAAALRTVKARLRDDAPPETQDRREAAAFATLVDRADLSAHRND